MRSPDALFNRNSSSSSKRKTVHIDVYCTASDSDTNSSTSSFDTDDELYTVLKSEKQNIYHRRAGNTELPLSIKKDIPSIIQRNESFSDDYSTCYPSRVSSSSTIRDFEQNPSILPSFSTLSSAGFHFDTTAEVSCRSSCSDMENIIQKYERLPYSDSFEYADSSDRERIKKMEQMWNDYGKLWRSPQVERNKQLEQQKKIQEYIDNKFKCNMENDCSDLSENVKYTSDEEKLKEVKLKRGSTLTSNRRLKIDTQNIPDDSEPTSQVVQPQSNITRAAKYGPVRGLIKKPGHHVGPAKNPDCTCAHCTEFFNKGAYRNRAHSLDNLPFSGTQNWRNILRTTQENFDSGDV